MTEKRPRDSKDMQCIPLMYYTHGMVHNEVYIQCITLIYYTEDMAHIAAYIQSSTLLLLHT